MKLWILEPLDIEAAPWEGSLVDKRIKFVIRADSEKEARELAQKDGMDELHTRNRDHQWHSEAQLVWTNPELVSCKELTADGPAEIISHE